MKSKHGRKMVVRLIEEIERRRDVSESHYRILKERFDMKDFKEVESEPTVYGHRDFPDFSFAYEEEDFEIYYGGESEGLYDSKLDERCKKLKMPKREIDRLRHLRDVLNYEDGLHLDVHRGVLPKVGRQLFEHHEYDDVDVTYVDVGDWEIGDCSVYFRIGWTEEYVLEFPHGFKSRGDFGLKVEERGYMDVEEFWLKDRNGDWSDVDLGIGLTARKKKR